MKPANFILDLLRTYAQRGTSAKNIMAAARLFQFNENLIRVNLSRLVARGAIENFTRGSYRLAQKSDPINDFVEEWRLGESRRRDWNNRYLIAYLDKVAERDHWVLTTVGFRELRTGFWSRPDNLVRTQAGLVELLHQLGLNDDVILGSEVRLNATDAAELQSLYDLQALDNRYNELTRKLNRSAAQLESLPHANAMRESFLLGGEAIQVLAKDPLMPDELQACRPRVKLWETMLRYDKTGREVWAPLETQSETHGEAKPATMPISMAGYA